MEIKPFPMPNSFCASLKYTRVYNERLMKTSNSHSWPVTWLESIFSIQEELGSDITYQLEFVQIADILTCIVKDVTGICHVENSGEVISNKALSFIAISSIIWNNATPLISSDNVNPLVFRCWLEEYITLQNTGEAYLLQKFQYVVTWLCYLWEIIKLQKKGLIFCCCGMHHIKFAIWVLSSVKWEHQVTAFFEMIDDKDPDCS